MKRDGKRFRRTDVRCSNNMSGAPSERRCDGKIRMMTPSAALQRMTVLILSSDGELNTTIIYVLVHNDDDDDDDDNDDDDDDNDDDSDGLVTIQSCTINKRLT